MVWDYEVTPCQKAVFSFPIFITFSIQRIQLTMLENTKAQTKRLSPRSSQHCLCPSNVSAGSVNSRCIGHRWLTATSVAQIQLGKKKAKHFFIVCLTYCSFSTRGKNWTNMPVASTWHLKWQGKCLSCECTHNGHRKHQWILPTCLQWERQSRSWQWGSGSTLHISVLC